MAVELSDRAVEGAAAAIAVHREGGVRNQARGRQRGPRGCRLQHQGRPARPVRRRHRLFRIAGLQPQRQLRSQQLHGSGDRVALDLSAGKYNKIYVFSHTDPYTTIDGVSRTTSFSYRSSSQFVSASSQLSSEQISAAMRWAYPISEYQSLQVGVSANEASLLTTQGYSSQQSVDWVRSNGMCIRPRLRTTTQYYFYGTKFNTYEISGGGPSIRAIERCSPTAACTPPCRTHCAAAERRQVLRTEL